MNLLRQEGLDVMYRSLDYQTSLESIGLSVQEKKFNVDFQYGGHLGFPMRTILAIVYLQVSLMLPTKHCWPFDSREEVKNRFSRWWPWISDGNDFSYF